MKKILHIVILLLAMASCREEVTIFLPEHVSVAQPEFTDIEGFYLLCEGNMGWNKATLDYYDYAYGEYIRNIFSYANPTVPKEMGDVGNDIGIYGSNLYCVINCSNKVDVLDKYTCQKKYQINIPNCRFIRFYGGYAYVTSYAGPVQINPNYEQRGYVAKIDTVTMQIVDTCLVGRFMWPIRVAIWCPTTRTPSRSSIWQHSRRKDAFPSPSTCRWSRAIVTACSGWHRAVIIIPAAVSFMPTIPANTSWWTALTVV